MNIYRKNTLRQNRVSYWDKANLGCLSTSYRRSGRKGMNITYRLLHSRRGKFVKRFANITGYPVCESFLYKASPWFGYEGGV